MRYNVPTEQYSKHVIIRRELMKSDYVCKIPTIEEMNAKWDYEISHSGDGRGNWVIWKKENIARFKRGEIIPYYGILCGDIICEATAIIAPSAVQNSEGLVGDSTAYLSAFRTIPEYQGRGYFSVLFWYMVNDLKARGYTRLTLGVELDEVTNRQIYAHFGFTEYIKSATETYPDGTIIDVDYFGKDI